MPIPVGTRLGNYEVVALIGEGGMGQVYRARDLRLGRDVAVKVLLDTVTATPDHVARFEREARSLAALNHPNIATLFEFTRDLNRHLLVMELVEGPTLAGLIDLRPPDAHDSYAEDPLSRSEILAIFIQIAEALEAAHERGIVHRDLKPANIKVGRDPLADKVRRVPAGGGTGDPA